MTIINKLRNTNFIITLSFYACLMLLPAIAQNGSIDFSAWTSFFFSRTLNIFLCIIPAVLAVFFSRKKIENTSVFLATFNTILLFFIHSEFLVSSAYFINLLVAIFIILFFFANTNEILLITGTIPFFFLSKLDTLHYIITVAVPLIFLLIAKLRTTENKTKKIIIKITLFIQCYICGFFAVLVLLKRYTPSITPTLPSVITTGFIIKSAASVLLVLMAAGLVILKNRKHTETENIADKLLFILPIVYFIATGIAGWFTDILSVKNSTSVLFALMYILIFGIQSKISVPEEKTEKTALLGFAEIAAIVLFCIAMIY